MAPLPSAPTDLRRLDKVAAFSLRDEVYRCRPIGGAPVETDEGPARVLARR